MTVVENKFGTEPDFTLGTTTIPQVRGSGNGNRPPTAVGTTPAAPTPDPRRRREIALKLALVARRREAAMHVDQVATLSLIIDELLVARYALQLARQFPRYNVWLDGIADCGEDAASVVAGRIRNSE